MKNVLYLKSSILGEQSHSNAMVNTLHANWTAKHPHATHVVRNLASDPVPHLTGESLAAPSEWAAQVLEQVKAADVLVIAAPMYNFSIPSTLKAWIDNVVKAGESFRYTASGPEGLLKGKRAVIVASSGSVFSDGPYTAADFVTPYLKTVLGFIGITDVEVIRDEGVALGESSEAQRAAAHERLRTMA